MRFRLNIAKFIKKLLYYNPTLFVCPSVSLIAYIRDPIRNSLDSLGTLSILVNVHTYRVG